MLSSDGLTSFVDGIRPRALREVVGTAVGEDEREDLPLRGTGGPAGNARLTAWTGLVLLGLILAELVSLVSIRQLISWHIVVGVLLVPPALLKTASTGWRIVRYYVTGGAAHDAYLHAGPPPLLLRLLGPFVVLSTLAVLASGLALIPLGPDSTRSALATVLGWRIDALTIHQACFVVWGVITGVHVLARTVPAVVVVAGRRRPRRVDGEGARLTTLVLALVAGVVAAVFVLGVADAWTSGDFHRERGVEGSVEGLGR